MRNLIAFLLALFPALASAQVLPGPFIIENKLSELTLLGPSAQAAAQSNLGLSAIAPLTTGAGLLSAPCLGTNSAGTIISATCNSISIGSTPIVGGTANGLLFDNGGVTGIISPANNGVGVTNGSGAFSISTTLPSGLNLGTPGALNLTNATGYPVGSATTAGIVKTDGSTITATAGTISCTTATATQLGCGKPDNATITATNGVWTAVGSAATAVTLGSTNVVGGTNNNLLYQSGGLLESEAPSSLFTTINGQACALTQTCTVTAAPGGSAGGDLSGTYPNPTVARVNGGLLPTSAAALASNGSSQIVAATTTGSGAVVLAASPSLTSPSLGTPSSINLSNATALPVGALPNVGANAITIGNGTSVETDTLTQGSGVTITRTGGAVTVSSTAAPPGGTTSQIQYNAGSGSFGGFTVGGDATLNVATGALTVTKTNGASFVASATTDTTNAGNISSGTLASARLPLFTSSAAGAVPSSGGGTANYLRADGTWATPSGSGTVTSVGMTVPSSLLAVSGQPVTSSGTFALSLVNQSANCVFAGPSSGVASAPSCRPLVTADLPATAVTGPGSSTNLFVPQWNGTTGAALGIGLPVTQSGAASSLVETDSGSNLTASGLLGAASNNLLIAPPDTGHLTVFKNGPNGAIIAKFGGSTPTAEMDAPIHLVPPTAWSDISTNAGIWENQAMTGSSAGPTFYNSLIINDQVADTSTQGSTPLYAEEDVSSASSSGPKNSIVSKFSLTGASGNTTGVGGSYSGGQFTANASAADNGTALTIGGSRGLLYGFNAVGELRSGATDFTQVSGGEVDCAVDTGASVLDNVCMQVVGLSRHAVAGARDDVLLSLNDQAGAAQFAVGLEFGRQGGIFPVTGGTMIGATGNLGSTFSVANGIDFHLGTATAYWERFGSVYSVDGSGNEIAHSLALGASTTSAAPLNIPQGTAPTSPNNGDVWTTSAGMYARINGTTVGPFGAGGSGWTPPTTGYLITANGTTPGGIAPVNNDCAIGASGAWGAALCQTIVRYTFTAGGGSIPATQGGLLVNLAVIPKGTSFATGTVTLPSAANYPAGTDLTISDESGSLSNSAVLTVAAFSSQTITIGSNTTATSFTMTRGGGFTTLRSDGSNWTLEGNAAANSACTDNGTLFNCTEPVAVNGAKLPTLTPYSVGWAAGQSPNNVILVADLPYAITLSSVVARVETALGSAGTVAVYIAPSGTACSAGTNIASNTFNANGAAATNQTLTLTTTSVPAGDSVCLQTTGSGWSSGASVMSVTAYSYPS